MVVTPGLFVVLFINIFAARQNYGVKKEELDRDLRFRRELHDNSRDHDRTLLKILQPKAKRNVYNHNQYTDTNGYTKPTPHLQSGYNSNNAYYNSVKTRYNKQGYVSGNNRYNQRDYEFSDTNYPLSFYPNSYVYNAANITRFNGYQTNYQSNSSQTGYEGYNQMGYNPFTNNQSTLYNTNNIKTESTTALNNYFAKNTYPVYNYQYPGYNYNEPGYNSTGYSINNNNVTTPKVPIFTKVYNYINSYFTANNTNHTYVNNTQGNNVVSGYNVTDNPVKNNITTTTTRNLQEACIFCWSSGCAKGQRKMGNICVNETDDSDY